MIKPKLLFAPGPVTTSERVKASLRHPDMCHRRPEFEYVVQRVRTNLLNLFNADDRYTVAVVSGSGTAANETALSSIIRDSDEVLLIKNGEFGERLDEIISCYRYRYSTLEYPWGTPPDTNEIESLLASNECIRWVCMVYHETSTGMINPIREVGRIVTQYHRHFFVDCVSAIGGEEIDVVLDNIDVCTGVPNKAVSGFPGVSFVVARRDCIPVLGQDFSPRNVYLNLQKHIVIADRSNQTPNTPAVSMFIALDEALMELQDESLGARIARYRQCAHIIRQGVRGFQLRTLLPDELSSNTVTSIFLPEGISLDVFIDRLDQRGYVVYPGKRHLYQQGMFQIANMGNIKPEDCEEFLRVLKDTLQELGYNTGQVIR